MRVLCKYSGEEFQVEGFSHKTLIIAEHPIFQAPTDRLLQRAGDWAQLRLNDMELKLLFLALLHSTGQVRWECAAVPSVQVIHSNMERLLRFLAWKLDILSPQLKLPQFCINRETRTLAQMPQWLEAWENIRKRWEMAVPLRHLQEKQSTRELALDRLIKSPTKNTEDYAGKLAAWAMDAAAVPEALREYWTELFKLRRMDVYSARTVDLEELVEHMECNLQSGSIYSYTVLQHCRTLLAKNRAGLSYALGIPLDDLDAFNPEQIISNPFRIVEDEIETENRAVIAATAPLEEPQERNYPNKIAYLRAKAAWTLAQKEQEKLAAFAAREIKALSTAEQDSITHAILAVDTANNDKAEAELEVSSILGTRHINTYAE